MWDYRAALPALPPVTIDDLVHDGDTVKILIDLGFDVRTEKWIRLADVHAPELDQPGGLEARLYTREWLAERAVGRRLGTRLARWPLHVQTSITSTAEPVEKTSFSRYVGWVWAGSDSLNDMINAYLAAHPEWPGGKVL